MRYLVLQPKIIRSTESSQMCVLSTHEAEDMLEPPFESWALNYGKMILYVDRRLWRDLGPLHIGGAFVTGAMYAYSYDDMLAILRDKLGPTDKDRCEALAQQAAPLKNYWAQPQPLPKHPGWNIFGHGMWRAALLACHIVWRSMYTILILVLIPLIIRLFHQRR